MRDVTICEMSPRDGLQFLGGEINAPALVPLERKIELVRALLAAKLPFIEVAAFVSPKITPEMADSDALARSLAPVHGVQLAALVPNLKHYERFRATTLDTVALFVSADEQYSAKNMGAPLADTLAWAQQVAAAARADGRRLRAHVSGAFQQVYTGTDSDPAVVARVVRELHALGCEQIALADTSGETHPRRVQAVIRALESEVPIAVLAVHLHDRGGIGLANALAAYEAGVRIFDASVAGIGGSATAAAPGAAGRTFTPGNVATEELVNLFERMGLRTGVELEELLAAGRLIAEIMSGTGDGAPPSRLLRERLGRGLAWT
jgi:hydroxymethylglutaryl-CoA lyase